MIKFSYFPLNLSQNADEKNLSTTFDSIINDSRFGFYHLTQNNLAQTESQEAFEKFKHKKVFVHMGIGGSSLGPEMVINSIQKNKDMKFVFINNIDSDEIGDSLQGVKKEDTLFYVVSKSGTTAETMAALSIIFSWGKFTAEDMKNSFVFCTDPAVGDLRQMANDLGITCLTVPANIGGRFSVLTSVGLFPALFAGIDVKALYEGAEAFKKSMNKDLFATSELLLKLKTEGVTQTVLMPYSSKLKSLSFWFVQLWAESLGKKKDKTGKVVHTGLTPIAAYGATDQHSQVQLFMEGPYDKCLCLIKVKNRKNNFELGSSLNYPSLKKLNGVNLNQLMEAEFQGTKKALEEAKRPHFIMEVEALNEQTLGALVLFFESLTALMGYRLNIDPFDQPGVEAGKIYAWEYINRV